jgi:hypothetical protein
MKIFKRYYPVKAQRHPKVVSVLRRTRVLRPSWGFYKDLKCEGWDTAFEILLASEEHSAQEGRFAHLLDSLSPSR